MTKPQDEHVQTTIRMSTQLVERADALIPRLTGEQGYTATRADVWRKALLLGLAELERTRGPNVNAETLPDDKSMVG